MSCVGTEEVGSKSVGRGYTEKKKPKLVINRVFFHINFDPLCCHIIFIFLNIWHWYFRTCQFGIFHTKLIWNCGIF